MQIETHLHLCPGCPARFDAYNNNHKYYNASATGIPLVRKYLKSMNAPIPLSRPFPLPLSFTLPHYYYFLFTFSLPHWLQDPACAYQFTFKAQPLLLDLEHESTIGLAEQFVFYGTVSGYFGDTFPELRFLFFYSEEMSDVSSQIGRSVLESATSTSRCRTRWMCVLLLVDTVTKH
jgi:hypothetical protein